MIDLELKADGATIKHKNRLDVVAQVFASSSLVADGDRLNHEKTFAAALEMARVMSAAPQMLRALKAVDAYFIPNENRVPDWLRAVRIAIAAAEGWKP